MDRVDQHRDKFDEHSVYGIYLSPLRALLNDIEERIQDYSGFINGRAFKWHGDVSRSRRMNEIDDPPEWLLTTPESLEVIFDSPSYEHEEFLGGVQFVVIDEVHYFVDSDRGAQLVSLLERLADLTGRDLQRVGLSATVGNPELVLDWFSGSSQRDREVVIPSSSQSSGPTISLEYYPEAGDSESQLKTRMIDHLTDGGLKKSIVFTLSRKLAEEWGNELDKTLDDRLHVHHGSVGKEIREEAEWLINRVGEKGKRCIISTSTLELGIDISNLDTIVQIGSLSSVSSFLQRLGRIREPDSDKEFLMITNKTIDFWQNLAILQLGDRGEVESYEPLNRNYPLLFQQLIGTILGTNGIKLREFWDQINSAPPFQDITYDELKLIVSYARDQGYLEKTEDLILFGDDGEDEFGKQNWLKIFSVFDVPPAVKVVKDDQEIGTLDSWWVYNKKLPFVFSLAGRRLRAKRLDEDSNVLYVEEAPEAIPPSWASQGPGIDLNVAQEMLEILLNDDVPKFIEGHPESETCLDSLRSKVNQNTIDPEAIGIQFFDQEMTQALLYTFAGDLINNTLRFIIEQFTGVEVSEMTSYSMELDAREIADQDLLEVLNGLLESYVDGDLVDFEKPETSFREEIVDKNQRTKFVEYLPSQLRARYFLDTQMKFGELNSYLRERMSGEVKLNSTQEATNLQKLYS